jgi:Ser-tRNA(Ala) deacylase AlaX
MPPAPIAFDRTCFYPGGGGPPPDTGRVEIDGADVIEIAFSTRTLTAR